MKIKYETTKGICHTECPYKVKGIGLIMVGSITCQACPSFVKKTKRIVECDMEGRQK